MSRAAALLFVFASIAAQADNAPAAPASAALAVADTVAEGASSASAAAEPAAQQGLTVEANIVSVAQSAGGRSTDDGQRHTRLTWRGDVSVSMPVGHFGRASGEAHGQLRFGRGTGISLRPSYSAAFDSTVYQLKGDGTVATLAEAWYQLNVPLQPGGDSRFELTVGKMDPFRFFDQNAAADDETTKFLNNVFVHGPLLDSGGDAGTDPRGFSSGVRIAWRGAKEDEPGWNAALAAYTSHAEPASSPSSSRPFVIAQVERTLQWSGRPAHYRLYAWHNGRANGLDGTTEVHAGWGASIDQRLTEALTLFTRFGQRTAGHGTFDRAVTLGGELGGGHWGRSDDAVGLAFAWLPTSSAWRKASRDPTLADFAASGAERSAELYYRWQVHPRVQLSPDLQWSHRPAGNPDASDIVFVGLRVLFSF
jgi:hypothetical protein